MKPRSTLPVLALVALVWGCAEPDPSTLTPQDEPSRPTAAIASGSIDRWLGDWDAPDGRRLRLEGGDGRYDITIIDEQGPHTFRGIAVTAERIIFDRDGTVESLSPMDSGPSCLTVRDDEGYCRR